MNVDPLHTAVIRSLPSGGRGTVPVGSSSFAAMVQAGDDRDPSNLLPSIRQQAIAFDAGMLSQSPALAGLREDTGGLSGMIATTTSPPANAGLPLGLYARAPSGTDIAGLSDSPGQPVDPAGQADARPFPPLPGSAASPGTRAVPDASAYPTESSLQEDSVAGAASAHEPAMDVTAAKTAVVVANADPGVTELTGTAPAGQRMPAPAPAPATSPAGQACPDEASGPASGGAAFAGQVEAEAQSYPYALSLTETESGPVLVYTAPRDSGSLAQLKAVAETIMAEHAIGRARLIHRNNDMIIGLSASGEA